MAWKRKMAAPQSVGSIYRADQAPLERKNGSHRRDFGAQGRIESLDAVAADVAAAVFHALLVAAARVRVARVRPHLRTRNRQNALVKPKMKSKREPRNGRRSIRADSGRRTRRRGRRTSRRSNTATTGTRRTRNRSRRRRSLRTWKASLLLVPVSGARGASVGDLRMRRVPSTGGRRSCLVKKSTTRWRYSRRPTVRTRPLRRTRRQLLGVEDAKILGHILSRCRG